uniref:Uncharacterized protein n=1 Tax=viral metagenome TaxID=1070528 RepID=A0A6C0E2Y1_9ZZZZ
MKKITLIFLNILNFSYADLRMASSPKKNFVVENGDNAIPFVKKSIAIYMEPSTFNYQGLKNQHENNYDNFLRSNIDNEQDNRNFEEEIGRDMLPFRTYEGETFGNPIITNIGKQTLIPLRWNNPHSSECEINIWIKSILGDNIVVPIKKPSCCGEGYQDNMISFTVPTDFTNLVTKIPGFTGCNIVGDCTLQIYAHSVEPRTYAIGSPILIPDSRVEIGTFIPTLNNSAILPSTIDPQLNIDYLNHEVCLSTISNSSNILSAVPRFARLVSDQFNHAYQNSNYSPYSGQQHESISKNLQAATILRMTAANGGELGKSIINRDNKKFIERLINNVNNVVEKYENTANRIFNKIKNDYKTEDKLGEQQLANCFRCSDTGSVNTNRIEQRTYIPSFEIPNQNLANQLRNDLNNDVINLIPYNSNSVQIYMGALKELSNQFQEAKLRGIIYQPAMIKKTITTMQDATNFLKVDVYGKKDKGVYASNIALRLKNENIIQITNSLPQNNSPTTPSPSYQYTTINNVPSSESSTLPPNPDDSQSHNFCGQTYETIDCNKPCYMGLDLECGDLETCYLMTTNKCGIPTSYP